MVKYIKYAKLNLVFVDGRKAYNNVMVNSMGQFDRKSNESAIHYGNKKLCIQTRQKQSDRGMDAVILRFILRFIWTQLGRTGIRNIIKLVFNRKKETLVHC